MAGGDHHQFSLGQVYLDEGSFQTVLEAVLSLGVEEVKKAGLQSLEALRQVKGAFGFKHAFQQANS